MSNEDGGELAVVVKLARLLGGAPPTETWAGDDAAVLDGAGAPLLFASDAIVEGVHFDRRYVGLPDIGWKALAVNVSDLAAMAALPKAAVVSVAGAHADELEQLYAGLIEASRTYACPIVGGDLSAGPALFISVAILGTTAGHPPLMRSGARAGDVLFVTGPLGLSAAGRRLLLADAAASGPAVDAHLRPRARLEAGAAARSGGARAMIDISDGLAVDVGRLASASSVGVELDDVPVGAGASLEEALGGGEDYELCFAAPDAERVMAAFEEADVPAPRLIGRTVEDVNCRRLGGSPLPEVGFLHDLS